MSRVGSLGPSRNLSQERLQRPDRIDTGRWNRTGGDEIVVSLTCHQVKTLRADLLVAVIPCSASKAQYREGDGAPQWTRDAVVPCGFASGVVIMGRPPSPQSCAGRLWDARAQRSSPLMIHDCLSPGCCPLPKERVGIPLQGEEGDRAANWFVCCTRARDVGLGAR